MSTITEQTDELIRPSVDNGPWFRRLKMPLMRGSHLTPVELHKLQQALTNKRKRLISDIAQLQNQASSADQSNNNGGVMSDPASMAGDAASDGAWQQTLAQASIQNKRSLLVEIDEALERINKSTYGICLATKKPIPNSLLTGMPWAKYCYDD